MFSSDLYAPAMDKVRQQAKYLILSLGKLTNTHNFSRLLEQADQKLVKPSATLAVTKLSVRHTVVGEWEKVDYFR